MSFKFIDDNTLNNIANAIRYKSSTDEKIPGSEFANAINNITTGSAEMSGNAFCFSGDTLYLGQNFELYNSERDRSTLWLVPLISNYQELSGTAINNIVLPQGQKNGYRAFASSSAGG